MLIAVTKSDGHFSRVVDLDVDIGADAVDYKSVLSTGCHAGLLVLT